MAEVTVKINTEDKSFVVELDGKKLKNVRSVHGSFRPKDISYDKEDHVFFEVEMMEQPSEDISMVSYLMTQASDKAQAALKDGTGVLQGEFVKVKGQTKAQMDIAKAFAKGS